MSLQPLIDLIKKGAAWAALGLLAWLGESGRDGGFIKDLWLAAKTASPFAAMFAVIVWMGERKERIEAQRQCNERTIDFTNAINASNAAWQALNNRLSNPTNRRSRAQR